MLSRFPRSFLRGPQWVHVRTFLSEAHNLTNEWNMRLSNPLIEKVNLDKFYVEIQHNFKKNNKIRAVDIDILANKSTDDQHMNELKELMHILRRSEEATSMLDSTGHAWVRLLLQYNQIDELIEVLDKRLAYGVILDDYTANMVLNKLIRAGQWKAAARVATIQMLQEDFTNPITRSLSLLACIKHLGQWEEFDDLKVPVEVEEPGKKRKVIEEKVRVKFIRNPYFDDHFDLRDSKLLLGKTLVYIGRETEGSLGLNLQVLGLALYQKFNAALELLDSAKGQEIYQFTVKTINEHLSEGSEDFKAKLDVIASTHKIVEFDVVKRITELCSEVVAQHEKAEVESQTKVYAAWSDVRQKVINDEMERLRRAERIKEVEKLSASLKVEEEKLWFFEKEDEIDLKIEGKRVFYPKRWFGNKKKPREVDTDYIPPDVDQRRNVQAPK